MKKIWVLLGLLWANGVLAQQAPQYTQYIFNEMIINPAYTGSKEVLNINATYRNQWTGIEGSPTTQTLSVDAASRSAKLGYGLNILNDKLGVQQQMGAYGNIAVRLQVGANSKLAMGFAAGVSQYTLDGTRLHPGTTQPDVAIPQGRETELLPDAKAGLFFNTELFYAGFSVANLIPFKGDGMYITTPRRHYFLSSGYIVNISPSIKLKPSFLVKEDFKAPTNVDMNTFMLFKESIWLGASYRTSVPLMTKLPKEYGLEKRNAWAVMTQIYIIPKFRVGYSYDINLNGMRENATHEVSLGYSLYRDTDARMLTPRYF
ncbi:PorP/SprF family type IX secretion system membrane protein [Pontibacter vulgaris]|uniref:PorP/SprF family type IX secretion system membrane protein n=1 Tax=Pontibacter vulgaris TaxID=2905679 RepID=UPI001FA8116D|nr:type IX secretion system membrane protein PorP/SprF [Pontibacter vulgaris]